MNTLDKLVVTNLRASNDWTNRADLMMMVVTICMVNHVCSTGFLQKRSLVKRSLYPMSDRTFFAVSRWASQGICGANGHLRPRTLCIAC
jgi:hypothetical protein